MSTELQKIKETFHRPVGILKFFRYAVFEFLTAVSLKIQIT